MAPPDRIDLDDVDQALVRALMVDGRATYAQLAPKVGLSQAAVRTRVQRLLDDRVITISGRVDPASLGLGLFSFAFLEVSCAVEDLGKRIAEVDGVVFEVVTTGRFDLVAEVRCVGEPQLIEALDRIRTLDGIRRLQTITVLHYEKHDWTHIGDRETPATDTRPVTPSHDLDEVDRRLLTALIRDGRATYAALAPIVGLSQAAVRDRVIDLLDRRIVTVQAVPIPEALGIGGFAAVAAKVTGPVEPLVSALVDLPETTLVARTMGRFDLLAEVWFDDKDHLAAMLDQLRAEPGMGSIDTLPYMAVLKEDFGVTPRS